MSSVKSFTAAALLSIACAAPAGAQSYQSQCGWVGSSKRGIYVCHSKTETARAEVLTSCISRRGGTECQSETFWKPPPAPPEPIKENPGGKMIVVPR